MIPAVSMETYIVPSTREPSIKVHLKVFDQENLRRVGNVGESFACDALVGINPTNRNSNKAQDLNETLIWPGGIRLHKIGANNTITKSPKYEPFDSDKFKTDNIGQHLTRKAVSEAINRIRGNMESLSEALLMYKGQSESNKEIPPLINVMRPHLRRKLTPSEITGMTDSKALALAHRALSQQTIDHDGGELRAYLKARTPVKYHKHGRVSIKLERRKDMFGIATGLTLTAAVKTARNLYCIEEAYKQLKSRLEQPRTSQVGGSNGYEDGKAKASSSLYRDATMLA